MKKIISCFLSLVCIITSIFGSGASVFASDLPTSGKCGENAFWKYDSKTSTMTVYGDGSVDDYDDCNQFWIDINTGEKLGIKHLVIDEGITSIGDETFYGCTELLTVSLPDTLTDLGFFAFGNCYNLQSINIPVNLTTAFSECGLEYSYNYKEINVDSDNKLYSSVDGILFNKDKTELIKYPQMKTDKVYTVPDTVKKIDDNAFRDNNYLETVNLSSSVKEIEYYAFKNCSALKNIDLNEVETIDENAFEKCISLKTVTIPKSVNYIGDNPFKECQALEKISVDSENSDFCIYNDALCDKDKTTLYSYPCKSQNTDFVIPNTVSSIPCFFFAYCDNLKNISIPASVTSINQPAFYFCDNTLNISIDENNPYYIFSDGLILSKTKDCVYYAVFGNEVTSYVIPESIKYIEQCAFSGCKSLSTLTISKNVEELDDGLLCATGIKNVYVDSENPYFSSADGVLFNKDKTELIYYPSGRSQIHYTIPDYVKKINIFAFTFAKSLQSVSIPVAVTDIPRSSFYETNIKTIYYGGTAKQWNDDLNLKIWNFYGIKIHFNNYYTGSSSSSPSKIDSQSNTEQAGVSSTKIASAKITKLNPKKKAIGVHWSKVKNVNGYQIQVATDKKFKKNKKAVTITKQSTLKKTIKTLKSKKRYYVRIRTFKTADGKRQYSSWSKIKSVKTK